jgi:hypothetical protein
MQRALQKGPPSFITAGRFEIVPPTHSLKLAEENEIAIHLLTPGVTKFLNTQIWYRGTDSTGEMRKEGIREAAVDLPLLFHAGGSSYVKIVPLRLGKIELTLWGRYPDGGLEGSKIAFEVELPSRSPKELIVGQSAAPDKTLPNALVYLEPKDLHFALPVSAVYDEIDQKVPIAAKYVEYAVRNQDDDAIELDPANGSIKPIRKGAALVETSFGGWKNLTCVIVEEDMDPNKIGSAANCNSLLQPGEKLGVPWREDDAP